MSAYVPAAHCVLHRSTAKEGGLQGGAGHLIQQVPSFAPPWNSLGHNKALPLASTFLPEQHALDKQLLSSLPMSCPLRGWEGTWPAGLGSEPRSLSSQLSAGLGNTSWNLGVRAQPCARTTTFPRARQRKPRHPGSASPALAISQCSPPTYILLLQSNMQKLGLDKIQKALEGSQLTVLHGGSGMEQYRAMLLLLSLWGPELCS